MDDKLIKHVALAVEPVLPGAYFTTCEKVAKAAIAAVNSYKHLDNSRTDSLNEIKILETKYALNRALKPTQNTEGQ